MHTLSRAAARRIDLDGCKHTLPVPFCGTIGTWSVGVEMHCGVLRCNASVCVAKVNQNPGCFPRHAQHFAALPPCVLIKAKASQNPALVVAGV